MKDFFSDTWNRMVKILYRIPIEKYVCFIAGMILTAFFALVIPGAIAWPAFPFILLAVIVCFISKFRGRNPKWMNALAFSLGCLIIQIFCWL